MNLQKRLAAAIMKCSPQRVHFDNEKAAEIKEAITKADIASLIKKGIISKLYKQGISQSRTRETKKQKRKGRQKGYGSRKGTHNSRLPQKLLWISSVRLQREFLKNLRDKELITTKDYRIIYAKSKGGFFRSIRHMKMYMTEQTLIKKD